MKYEDLSDMQLLGLLRRDDQQALSALYYKYWDRMLSVACSRVNDLEVAEELVQDIFYSFWERRRNLVVKYTVATYLSVAVKYKVINYLDHCNRLRLRNEELQSMPPVFEPSAEEYLYEKELWTAIEATIKQLPEKCQLVFRLSRIEGKSHKEIATELDISEKTVENHISRAIKGIKSNSTIVIPTIFAGLVSIMVQ